MNGHEMTEYFYDINTKSYLTQNFSQPIVPKPRGKYIIGRWKLFIQWMYDQNVFDVYDFKDKARSKYKISECNRYFKITEDCSNIIILKQMSTNDQ